MITTLTGTVESVEKLAVAVRPKGVLGEAVALEVLVPAYHAAVLAGQVGKSVTLHTVSYMEGQGQGTWFIPRLIGFPCARDRQFFDLMTSVSGIGNRKALRSMAVAPASIARAIAAKDAKALTQLPEIGKKLAETIIVDLHAKAEAFLTVDELQQLNDGADGKVVAGRSIAAELKPSGALGSPVEEEAVLVLVALGETRAEAEQRVVRAVAKAKQSKTPIATSDALVQLVFAGTR